MCEEYGFRKPKFRSWKIESFPKYGDLNVEMYVGENYSERSNVGVEEVVEHLHKRYRATGFATEYSVADLVCDLDVRYGLLLLLDD